MMRITGLRMPSLSTFKLIMILSCSIFASEMIVDLLLPGVLDAAGWVHALADASVLIAVTFPFLYFFSLRPLKNAMDKLCESEDRFRTLIVQAPDGIEVLDRNGRFVEVNPATTRGLGYTREELLKMTVFDVDAEITRDKFEQLWPTAASSNPLRFESTHRRKDGSTFRVELSISALRLNGIWRSLAQARDVTERKRIEERTGRLAEIVESSDDIIISKTLDGIITSWNRGAENIYGYTEGEMIGKPISVLIPSEFEDELPSILKRIRCGEHIDHYETVRERKDGRSVNISLTISPIRDSHGGIIGASTIGRDITDRKLLESEMRLQSEIAAHIAEGIYLVSVKDLRIVYANSRMEEIFGYAHGEMNGKHVSIINAPTDADPVKTAQNIEKALRDIGVWRGEVLNRRKNGTPFWGHASISLLSQSEYGPVYVSLQTDITERKRIEQQLKESLKKQEDANQRIKFQIDRMPLGYISWDQEHKVTEWNKSAERIFGWTASEVIGIDASTLIVADKDRSLLEKVRDGLLTNDPSSTLVVNENVRKDGLRLTCEWFNSTLRDAEGRLIGFLSMVNDITEQKRAEEAKQESEEKFRLISENIADLIAVYNLSGECTYRSPSYERIFGKSPSLAQLDVLHEIHPDDRRKVQSALADTITHGMSKRVDHRIVTQDGSVRSMESQGSPIHDKEGATMGVVVVSRDVTEKKLLEQQFLRAQRLESLGTLAGGVAHDLNNVLSPVLTSIVLLRKFVKEERGLHILSLLEKTAERGASIVKQVLGFARGVKGERTSVQIYHVVKELMFILQETFPKTITIQTSMGENLWNIIGDPTQIHQVLMNLCVNARDAMQHGGNLSLSVENALLDEQYAGMHLGAKPGKFVLMRVDDSGSGIPPELMDKVFDPFFTTKGIGKGTGLGLSTVHTIVKSHGGFVNVYSELGKGTTFKVYLPAAEASDIGAQQAITDEIPHGNGELILIVDDEHAIRFTTQQTLEAHGYRTVVATDGAEAVAAYASLADKIAVVLTDMMMPVMDGVATIRALRRLNPRIKIIASSGLLANDYEPPEASLHTDAFLPKPFSASTLLKSIHDVLLGQERDTPSTS